MRILPLILAYLKTYWFNLINWFYHPSSTHDLRIIKQSRLFDDATTEDLKLICRGISRVKYLPHTLIFSEGDIADAVYIIEKGAVRVYTEDLQGKKISVAYLTKGQYFGEQALIHHIKRIASVETAEESILIRIAAPYVLAVWNKHLKIKRRLKRIGYQQVIQTLSTTTTLYNDFKNIFNQKKIKKFNILELPPRAIIFKINDKPDNIYFILNGKVEIELNTQDNPEIRNSIHLTKGQFFGELSFIANQPRKGTAIALTDVRLLAIPGDQFTRIYNRSHLLRDLLKTFRNLYNITQIGLVQQFYGGTPETGNAITSIFKLQNGESVIAVHSLKEKIFTMSITNAPRGDVYEHKRGKKDYIKIRIDQHHVIGIEAYGEWDYTLPQICGLLLNQMGVDAIYLKQFPHTGLLTPTPVGIDDQIICNCLSVTRQTLQKLIDQGITEVSMLSQKTGAGTVCGSCHNRILEMLGKDFWIPAIMQEDKRHNADVRSYHIKLVEAKAKSFSPGKHITILVPVAGETIERSYTISEDRHRQNAYQITIKKNQRGGFTSWLFDQPPKPISIQCTQPRGEFGFNPSITTVSLGFAGGIGITPFIAYAKSLREKHSQKPLTVLYCVKTDAEWLFLNDLKEIMKEMPHIHFIFRKDQTNGILTEQEILQLVADVKPADIYICGPTGFSSLICNTLKQIEYPLAQIHIEKFSVTAPQQIMD